MKVAVGSDHAGFDGRQAVLAYLRQRGIEIKDFGPADKESVDYPDYAHTVAEHVASGQAQFGVLVCGTGQGMAMASNRHPGVRAAVITDEFTAEMARAHNDANIACFGERVVGVDRIPVLLEKFLDTQFENERHAGRVNKIETS